MNIQTAIDQFTAHPKRLFLIDGFGALLSAFLLGVVLVQFKALFGIPIPTLYFLAALPCFFALYDFIVFFSVNKAFSNFLKIIATVNVLYCILSISLAFYHHEEITYLGWAYIIGEIAIVLFLANIEWKTGRKIGLDK